MGSKNNNRRRRQGRMAEKRKVEENKAQKIAKAEARKTAEAERSAKRQKPEVTIHINPENQGQTVFPIRWSINQAAVDHLAEHEVLKPYILITKTFTLSGKTIEEIGARQLFPLSQEMAYVEFYREGNYKLHAFLVWDTIDNTHELEKYWLGRWSEIYKEELFSWCDQGVISNHNDIPHTSKNVHIDPQFFASEPSQLHKWWVNLPFDLLGINKPKDQCAFRRRAWLFSYHIWVPMFVIWCVIAITIRSLYYLWGMLWGMRKLNPHAVYNVFRYSSRDIYCTGPYPYDKARLRRSVFYYDQDGQERPSWVKPFAPAFLMIAGSLVLILWKGVLWVSEISMTTPSVFSLASVIIITTVVTIIYLLEALVKHYNAKMLRREEEELLLVTTGVKFKDMVSDSALAVSVDDLPSEKQTIFLRFQKLKAEVCRPFKA